MIIIMIFIFMMFQEDKLPGEQINDFGGPRIQSGQLTQTLIERLVKAHFLFVVVVVVLKLDKARAPIPPPWCHYTYI